MAYTPSPSGDDSTYVFLFKSLKKVFVEDFIWSENPKNFAKTFSVERAKLG